MRISGGFRLRRPRLPPTVVGTPPLQGRRKARPGFVAARQREDHLPQVLDHSLAERRWRVQRARDVSFADRKPLLPDLTHSYMLTGIGPGIG